MLVSTIQRASALQLIVTAAMTAAIANPHGANTAIAVLQAAFPEVIILGNSCRPCLPASRARSQLFS
ncbi:hypothetical protein QT977_28350 [Microcoleus sp. Z1_C4]